jgi:hypothetical protein
LLHPLLAAIGVYHRNQRPLILNKRVSPTGWKFVAGIQPKNSAQLSPEAAYSGLLECPCTDRITKQIDGAASTRAAGACPGGGPTTLVACKQAALSQLGSWGVSTLRILRILRLLCPSTPRLAATPRSRRGAPSRSSPSARGPRAPASSSTRSRARRPPWHVAAAGAPRHWAGFTLYMVTIIEIYSVKP